MHISVMSQYDILPVNNIPEMSEYNTNVLEYEYDYFEHA